jgi:NAD(P)-dependent dehydrogenase (short-subunit alcohol dehydrogenase family)
VTTPPADVVGPEAVLAGRRALVIGGGSGIGLATARRLALDGAAVTIAGRTAATLREATRGLRSAGLDVSWIVCDAMRSESVRAAVDAAHGGAHLDVAVCSVPGGGRISPILFYNDDEISSAVLQNVQPVFLVLKHAARAMLGTGSGAFVAVSSTAAERPLRSYAAGCVGKAAVDQLVRVAADELGPAGIRVNAVRPGLTRTPLTETSLLARGELSASFLARQPLARHGAAEEVAHAIRFLAGPESSWTTGQILTVDGGLTLRTFPDYARAFELPDQLDVARRS